MGKLHRADRGQINDISDSTQARSSCPLLESRTAPVAVVVRLVLDVAHGPPPPTFDNGPGTFHNFGRDHSPTVSHTDHLECLKKRHPRPTILTMDLARSTTLRGITASATSSLEGRLFREHSWLSTTLSGLTASATSYLEFAIDFPSVWRAGSVSLSEATQYLAGPMGGRLLGCATFVCIGVCIFLVAVCGSFCFCCRPQLQPQHDSWRRCRWGLALCKPPRSL